MNWEHASAALSKLNQHVISNYPYSDVCKISELEAIGEFVVRKAGVDAGRGLEKMDSACGRFAHHWENPEHTLRWLQKYYRPIV